MSLPPRMKAFSLIAVAASALEACFPGQATEPYSREGHTLSPSVEQSYKVYKIKTLKNLYLIYARRNDSIFEIVSRKEQATCRNIKVGHSYHFELRSRFGNESSPLYTPRSNRLLVTHSNFYGTLVPLESAAHGDLYTAKHLRGLCLESLR